MRYGFIGLGNLGARLAESLIRGGFDPIVYDRNEAAASALVSKGARALSSARELAAAVDAVITCLPSPSVTEAVLTDTDGILAGLARGATWIEMSTVDPETIARLAALSAEKGIATLEAPVTGGVHLAATGRITILVGGEKTIFDQHRAAFEAMGAQIFHMGKLGTASVTKVVTNMLAFINVVAVGEALMLARRSGLDLAQVYRAIKASSGNSFVHETESQVILNGSYKINFTMDLACKDLGIAMKFGGDLGVPLDLGALTAQTFIRARAAYGGDAWSSQVVKLLEDSVHTDLRADGFPAELSDPDETQI
jgi:3-hydroxyisobutyrate dehydrogenase